MEKTAIELYCKYLVTENSGHLIDLDQLAIRYLPKYLATNFSIRITREDAINRLIEGDESVMCKEYGEDDDWVGLTMDDLNEDLLLDDDYQTFELWLLPGDDEEKVLDYIYREYGNNDDVQTYIQKLQP